MSNEKKNSFGKFSSKKHKNKLFFISSYYKDCVTDKKR